MSREFTFHIGPRDPNDEDRIIRAVMRQAQPGDKVTLDSTFGQTAPDASNLAKDSPPPSPQERTDDETAGRFADGLNSSLERKNEELDQAVKGQTVPTPEKQAKLIAAATRSVQKSWRQLVNEAGWKVVVEAVLKTAWDSREQAWGSVRTTVRDMLDYIFGGTSP